MVKLYLKNKNYEGKDYIEVKYSSILKSYFLGWLGFTIIALLIGFVVGYFLL